MARPPSRSRMRGVYDEREPAHPPVELPPPPGQQGTDPRDEAMNQTLRNLKARGWLACAPLAVGFVNPHVGD